MLLHCTNASAALLLSCIVFILSPQLALAQGDAATLITMDTEYSDAAGNAIHAVLAPLSHTLAIRFTFAACTGLQIHYHTNAELFQPVKGRYGRATVLKVMLQLKDR